MKDIVLVFCFFSLLLYFASSTSVSEPAEFKWKLAQNETLYFAVDSEDNVISVSTRKTKVWYNDGLDGSLLWSIDVHPPEGYYYCSTYPVQTNGAKIAVRTTNCGKQGYECLYNCFIQSNAIDISTGEILWNYTQAGTPYSTPLVDAEALYLISSRNGSNDTTLSKILLSDASVAWSVVLPYTKKITVQSVLSPLGFVYILAESNLYGFNTQSGKLQYTWPLWSYPNGIVPMYSAPSFSSDGTLYITAQRFFISLNSDTSLRFWTTNKTVYPGEISFDEQRNQVYVGWFSTSPTVNSEKWQAYDPITGLQNWNLSYTIGYNYVGDQRVHAPLVRESDGLLVFFQNFGFVGRSFGIKEVVFNYTAPFTYPTSLTKPIMRKDGTAFYVGMPGYNYYQLWSVALPPPQGLSAVPAKELQDPPTPGYHYQCGTPCTSYADCDGFLCSKCQNNICVQPVSNSTTVCSYRGDCDERSYTCMGTCTWLFPGCADRCDYWATCSSGCFTCNRRCQSP